MSCEDHKSFQRPGLTIDGSNLYRELCSNIMIAIMTMQSWTMVRCRTWYIFPKTFNPTRNLPSPSFCLFRAQNLCQLCCNRVADLFRRCRAADITSADSFLYAVLDGCVDCDGQFWFAQGVLQHHAYGQQHRYRVDNAFA